MAGFYGDFFFFFVGSLGLGECSADRGGIWLLVSLRSRKLCLEYSDVCYERSPLAVVREHVLA